ncbi:MAG: hypothetical protein WEA10_01455 [Actinomycetota bacterium]
MQSHRPLRGIPTFAAAAAGVLAGHQLTYLLAHPATDQRHAALVQTGHDYLPFAGKIVLALTLAGVLTLALRLLSAGPFRAPDTDDLAPLAAKLYVIQLAVFTSMEVGERFAAHAPLNDLLGAGLLPIGVLALAGTALIGAFVLRWLHRATAVAIAAMCAQTPPATASIVGRDGPALCGVREMLTGAAGVRGPPALTR